MKGAANWYKRYLGWLWRHKIVSAVIIIIIVIAAVASGGGNKKNTNSTTTASTTTQTQQKQTTSKSTAKTTATSAKKASWKPELYAVGDTGPISTTLPAAGWDANDGWDTAAQAEADATSTTAVIPAVTIVNSHELEVDLSVENTGNATGSARCFVDATSATPAQEAKGEVGIYEGYNYVTPKQLNGSSSIKSGQSGISEDDVTISKNGAAQIKYIKVTCS